MQPTDYDYLFGDKWNKLTTSLQ